MLLLAPKTNLPIQYSPKFTTEVLITANESDFVLQMSPGIV